MRQTRRRAAGATAIAMAMTVALAGCGGGTQPGESPATGGGSGAGGGAASAWILTGGGWPVTAESFARWNKENPDQQISVEEFENDAYKEKIRTSVGSGQAPTLIMNWTGGTLASYVKNDQVVDITDQTKDLVDRVMPSVAQNGQIDGATYAVPMNDVQPVILFYNKELFDQADIEVPTTWDETLKAVDAFKAEGIIPFSLAGASVWPELMWIQYLTDRIGGPEVFQAVLDGEPDAWSDPAVTEALTKIQELVDAGAFGDAYGSVDAGASADAALVHTGRAAMLLQGSWLYATFHNDAPEFAQSSLGFTTFPEIEGGAGDPANIVGNPANFWSISSAADESAQKTALAYVNEYVYDDTQIKAMLDAGSVPPVAGLEDQIGQSEDAEYLSFAYGMVNDAPHFQLSWDQALPADQAQELLTNLSQIFLGQIEPQEFVDNMNATL
ncbi:carbohydrate ABC transporter substrate-binding protein (CUT1 family) [Georgenia soli]|uniref:Carbohydrate ABC transporter substrate-binding protein (CUT1 family) n=1 Tax=Georgenia soli TaxID=638953 RepID=A0A2A9ENH4_9MICO|nr:extracellular solute-binding protein [Georgenia soli]PFG40333.1 carbohydrate ABC transporter substrate-binding protein (CUT1 family) [Georgenia soli]